MPTSPRLVPALAAGLLCAPAVLAAQAVPGQPPKFGVVAGLATPAGALADFTHAGYSVAALAQTTAREGRGVALRGELGYTSLAGDRRTVAGAAVAYPATRVISGALTLVLLPTDPDGRPRPRLYFLGGAGVYRFDYGSAAAPGAVAVPGDQTRAGVNVGAGLRFPLGPARLSVETRFHTGLGDATAARFFQPVAVALAF